MIVLNAEHVYPDWPMASRDKRQGTDSYILSQTEVVVGR